MNESELRANIRELEAEMRVLYSKKYPDNGYPTATENQALDSEMKSLRDRAWVFEKALHAVEIQRFYKEGFRVDPLICGFAHCRFCREHGPNPFFWLITMKVIDVRWCAELQRWEKDPTHTDSFRYEVPWQPCTEEETAELEYALLNMSTTANRLLPWWKEHHPAG